MIGNVKNQWLNNFLINLDKLAHNWMDYYYLHKLSLHLDFIYINIYKLN